MSHRHTSERGFAVLMVFMMAATVCIYLYIQMPRVAFEAQRAKEEMLIERGEQYKRAIQLFVRHNKTYPSKIEDLENFNGKRYLRRRYKDPMTGKEEWRAIHVGPGGVLLDSKVYKPKAGAEKAEKKSENTFISEGPSMAAPEPGATQAGAAAVLRTRPSDRPGAPGALGAPVPGMPPGMTANPAEPALNTPPSPFLPVGQATAAPVQEIPGQPSPGQAPPGQFVPAAPGQSPPMPVPPGQFVPGAPGLPVQTAPGQPFVPGMPGVTPQQFRGAAVAPAPAQPGPSFVIPGAVTSPPVPGAQAPQQLAPGAAPNPALEMIQRLLTTPRPGGQPGAASQPAGQTIGGGIAGFASTYDAEGIKVYRERTNYTEWEFIYDVKEDLQKSMPAGVLQPPGASPSKETGGSRSQPLSPQTPAQPPTRRPGGP
jgi:hypothetical protein